MPKEGIEPVSHSEILRFEETERLAGILAQLGITKIRITGGEPLVRKDIINFISALTRIPGIEEVSLTTNGVRLSEYAWQLKEAGIKRINVSLDTLRKVRFTRITGSDSLGQVLEGIKKAKAAGLMPLKINTVIMKGINEDEIIDFVNFSGEHNLILRFIEFMKVTPLWSEDYFFPIEKVKDICRSAFEFKEAACAGFGPAQYLQFGGATVGFIKTDTQNCRQCNRLRLTATGDLKVCLYEDEPFSLRELLRAGAGDKEIKDALEQKIMLKEKIDYRNWDAHGVYMSSVGG